MFVGSIYGRGASQIDLMIDAISLTANRHQDGSCLLMQYSDIIFLNRWRGHGTNVADATENGMDVSAAPDLHLAACL